jgi:1-deoxy-D-xylulose-5-phosphate reductoisomerase
MAPAVFNAANEELVAAFHAGHVPFLGIVDTVRDVLMDWLSNQHADAGNPGTVEDVEYVQGWARARARAAIAQQP